MGYEGGRWAAAVAAIAAVAAVAAAFSATVCWRRSRWLSSRVRELEASLKASIDKGAAERRGRTRVQQALRKALLAQQGAIQAPQASNSSSSSSYPMTPIAVARSCFSTRNGTPRQPLLVPLARACMVLNPTRVPPEALEGLAEYSHCWILYVFHLNTDLEKLWKEPSRSKFKAKVRVPRLKGGKKGVLATRSPHRPCPIGLTVAKVEAVDGCRILLSGVDLVDGTPVLDIKPYLPYSDYIEGATVPKWLEVDNSLAVASVNFSPDFSSSLAKCWETVGKHSLYGSPSELQDLVKQVLSWDIRSVAQQNHPHHAVTKDQHLDASFGSNHEDVTEDTKPNQSFEWLDQTSPPPGDITYHLALEGVDILYTIDVKSYVTVLNATLSSSGKT